MSEPYEVLGLNEVVTLQADCQLLLDQSTFKVTELLQPMRDDLSGEDAVKEKWFGPGMECEVLSPNKGWRKGKVRICVAFLDDEHQPLPSPLDSIRKAGVK